MFKFKSQNAYWQEFSSYQSFSTVDDMTHQIDLFVSTYELTPAIEAVLNTLKLHSKRFIGVCWLYREEIARKAGVSLSSVKRAIKGLKESGILTVHEHIHTKRGGKTHNIYVINPIFETTESPSNEPSQEDISEQPNLCPASDSAIPTRTYTNSHTNSHKTLKDNSIYIDDTSVPDSDVSDTTSLSETDILKRVPTEFIDIMKPYYDGHPEVILARWKTTCVAVKKACISFENTSWDTIEFCWKKVVSNYKRKRIKNTTDDGLGGYFYATLTDWLFGDMLKYGLSR